jgi:hypothetical protein
VIYVDEAVQGAIFVIGALILTVMTVGIGISVFSSVDIPKTGTVNVSRPGELAELIKSCWRESDSGSSIKRMDCYKAQVDAEFGAADVRSQVSELPSSRFNVPDLEFSSVEV